MSDDGAHAWVSRDGWTYCSRCGEFRYSERKTCPRIETRDDVDPVQRAGFRPRTVEVGMMLCRPSDGVCASAWLVESVRPGVSATLSDCDHHDRHLPVALAAITHPDGGWVLAADWAPQEAGEVAR